MIKPISFTGVYKFNTSYENVQNACSFINNRYYDHKEGYPVLGSDEFVFSDVNYTNEVVPVCYNDEKSENYILTDEQANEASIYYSEMIDEFDFYSSYYGADELFDISCDISAQRYQDRLKSIVDTAKEKGIVQELNLEVSPRAYDNNEPPRFSIVG